MIALSGIAVAKHRLRPLREDTATALAQSMADQGQLQPIVVRPRKDGCYWLVAGLHRFEAAKKLKWKEINCTIFDGMEADEAELAEVDENLIRAELSPAERALHIGKRKELYEQVYPATKKGGAPGKAGGGKKAKTAKLATFARDTATKTRVSRRSVERDATRAKRVVVLGEIVDTPLDKGAEIDALAKLPESEQRSIAEAVKRGDQVSARIHGISWADVEAQPTFIEVWDHFLPFWKDADYFLAQCPVRPKCTDHLLFRCRSKTIEGTFLYVLFEWLACIGIFDRQICQQYVLS
jgi:hypothetical protein